MYLCWRDHILLLDNLHDCTFQIWCFIYLEKHAKGLRYQHWEALKKSNISQPRARFEEVQDNLKLVSAIFIKILFFHQMIVLQKLWKMLFISSKKLFSFSRYSIFYISFLPSFLPVAHCFRGWPKISLKFYDVINCLNKSSIRTNFVWYLEKENRYDIETVSIDGVSDNERFYGKMMRKICSKS